MDSSSSSSSTTTAASSSSSSSQPTPSDTKATMDSKVDPSVTVTCGICYETEDVYLRATCKNKCPICATCHRKNFEATDGRGRFYKQCSVCAGKLSTTWCVEAVLSWDDGIGTIPSLEELIEQRQQKERQRKK